jgi:hypothetical protein
VRRRSQSAWHAQRAQVISPREKTMFSKILIANRGDRASAASGAAKPKRLARAACAGDLAAGATHV